MKPGNWSGWLFGSKGKPSARRKAPGSKCTRLLVERLEERALLAADLVAFRPVTEHLNFANYPIAGAVETDTRLGPGIRINGDNDNGNELADYLEDTATAAENDLVRVDVSGSGELTASWSGWLRVWETPIKGSQLDNGDFVTDGQSLWVEYMSQDHALGDNTSLTLTSFDNGSFTQEQVVFHTFQSVVIDIGGNSQDPAKVGDPQLGIFTVGATLYQQGYDVHLYSHSQVSSSGQGAAYDEVVSGVLNRNVNFVAILGYSWGGGATYELASGLNNNADLAGKYELTYTAYVDGIRHNSLSAEQRLPPATKYHDNLYQRRDWLLRGNSVAGANNINVTNTRWGKRLTHTTIDDHATVQEILVNNLINKLSARIVT